MPSSRRLRSAASARWCSALAWNSALPVSRWDSRRSMKAGCVPRAMVTDLLVSERGSYSSRPGAAHAAVARSRCLLDTLLSMRHRQPHQRRAALAAAGLEVGAAVLERERAAVGLGDLARERQADAGALGLGGIERHEQVGGVGDARTLVVHAQLERAVGEAPLDPHSAARLERGVGGVPHQVD